MKKTSLFVAFLATALLAGGLSGASTVEAQVYTAPSYYSNGCVNLSAPLTIGSSDVLTGGQVSQLQQFLVRTGLLSSVFATGYFGNDTAAAVARFQVAHAIPPVGVVGPLTRAAIAQVSCAGTYPGIPPVNPVYPTYPTYPTYPGNAGIYLSSLSSTSGVAGSVITLYGNNFAQWGNTVNFGTVSISGLSSTGNSIVVTVPSLSTGTYQVSVTNSNGTTNSLQFMVTNNWQACPNTYSYSNQCGCPVYNNGSYYNNTSMCYPYPTIRVNSVSAAPQTYSGTVITVYGTGFSPSGNTVHFDGTTYSNVYSYNGTSLSFTIPYSALYSYNYGGNQTVPVYVVNATGMTSNTIQFTLNNSGNGYGNPTISSVSGPTNVTTGTQNTYTVYLNNVSNQYVTVTANWGDSSGNTTSQQVFMNGNGSVSMTHAYYNSGTYTIQFSVNSNSSSYQAPYTYTVYVTGSGNGYGSPYISYLSPQQGNVGTTVAIQGTGFSTYGNTIHFSTGGARNLQSYNNGTVIYYIIPHTVSGCDLLNPGEICAQYVQQITPGSYPLYVTNQNNQSSNTQSFRVY